MLLGCSNIYALFRIKEGKNEILVKVAQDEGTELLFLRTAEELFSKIGRASCRERVSSPV